MLKPIFENSFLLKVTVDFSNDINLKAFLIVQDGVILCKIQHEFT